VTRRTATASVLIVTLLLQACRVSTAPAGSGPQPQQVVRISSSVPFAVHLVGERPGAARCHATTLEGGVRSVAGDTITFGRIYRLTPARGFGPCRARGTAFIVGAEVTQGETVVRRTSPARTVGILFVGAGLAVLSLIVLLCGDIEICLGD
jgi:hypothetical protein